MTEEYRQCSMCKEKKPATEEFFRKAKVRNKYFFRGECRDCGLIKGAEQRARRTPEQKERERMLAKQRVKRLQKEAPLTLKDYDIKKIYGRPYGFYEATFKAQGGQCWLCKKTPEELGIDWLSLHVDHNHNCSYCQSLRENPSMLFSKSRKVLCEGSCITGLLCPSCNWRKGAFDALMFLDGVFNPRWLIEHLGQYTRVVNPTWEGSIAFNEKL